MRTAKIIKKVQQEVGVLRPYCSKISANRKDNSHPLCNSNFTIWFKTLFYILLIMNQYMHVLYMISRYAFFKSWVRGTNLDPIVVVI